MGELVDACFEMSMEKGLKLVDLLLDEKLICFVYLPRPLRFAQEESQQNLG